MSDLGAAPPSSAVPQPPPLPARGQTAGALQSLLRGTCPWGPLRSWCVDLRPRPQSRPLVGLRGPTRTLRAECHQPAQLPRLKLTTFWSALSWLTPRTGVAGRVKLGNAH